MNKYLVAILPVAFGGVLIAGCNNQMATQADAESKPHTHTAETAHDAPMGSTAKDAEKKTGDDHHPTAEGAMKAHAHSTRLDFTATPNAIPVGKPATWTLKITDLKSGAPVNDYEVEMTKLMHLIVVKNDLSWFNHIHPQFKSDGIFKVTTTLPQAGTYKLYADYTLKGKGQEVPQHVFATGGAQTTANAVQLVPDAMKGPWLTKKVTSHREGDPNSKGGATYEVAMMPMPSPLVAGQDSMLHFQIRDAKGVPIKDLQPYLGAMGHCVILSQDTTKYLHSHPMQEGAKHDMSKMGAMDMSRMNDAPAPKSGGPDVMFHTNFPTAGLYKAWGQFQHKGKIITAAFVVNVGAAKGGAQAATAESKAHLH